MTLCRDEESSGLVCPTSPYVTFAPERRSVVSMDEDLTGFAAVYESLESTKPGLQGVEPLHKEDLIGSFDAAVVGRRHRTVHVAKHVERPMVRLVPEELGFGPPSRKGVGGLADELSGDQRDHAHLARRGDHRKGLRP